MEFQKWRVYDGKWNSKNGCGLFLAVNFGGSIWRGAWRAPPPAGGAPKKRIFFPFFSKNWGFFFFFCGKLFVKLLKLIKIWVFFFFFFLLSFFLTLGFSYLRFCASFGQSLHSFKIFLFLLPNFDPIFPNFQTF